MGIFDSVCLKRGTKSTRFIHLEAATTSGNDINHNIQGSLDVFTLEDAPEYEALSYTWGVSSERINIKLNDQPFSVSPNLHAVLRQLSLFRSHGSMSHGRLWIDAICINQNDEDEKSEQVMQMTEIYVKAKRVLLWIGESDTFSALAFDTLRRFAQDDGTTDGSATYCNLLDTREIRVEAISKLSERPYFARVWVIQEAVAASVAIVLCGSELMDLTDFSRAFSRLTGSGFYPHSLAINERDNALDLQTLLMYSRDKLCKDNRDKVYALRGIGVSRFAEGIIVDYSDTVERVYINCAKHWLTARSDLRVLSTIEPRHSAASSLKLPSWVPDWSQHNHNSGVMQRYFRFRPEHMFCAARKTVANVTFSKQPDILTIKGVRPDNITKVIQAKSCLGFSNSEPTVLTPIKFADFVAGLNFKAVYAPTRESLPNAVLRTVTADRTRLSSRVADNYRYKYLTSYCDWRLTHDSSIFDLPESCWKELSLSTTQILDDKDMFMTNKGYMGIARSGFSIGDLVCIFFGGEVPFIVRYVEHDPDIFRFISECYVHGIMDGEAMPSQNAAEEENFQLR